MVISKDIGDMDTRLPEQPKRGMKPREFARMYGLAENLVYEKCRSGEIPNVRIGTRFVILWEQWEAQAKLPVPPPAKNNASTNK
jgi:predicted DNA-binding transcriptional regulator AlpA